MSKKTYDVTLSTPVVIDGKETSFIDIRKPKAGELRGLKLSDILQMDCTAMMALLPRITTPPLDAAQLGELDLADFTTMSVKTVSFFAKPGQLEQMKLSS